MNLDLFLFESCVLLMENSFVIDNQVVYMTPEQFLIIRPIGSGHGGKVKTWGSRLIDNQALSLLATRDMDFDEIPTITTKMILKRIENRKSY